MTRPCDERPRPARDPRGARRDRKLLSRAAKGDRAALEQFYNRHVDALYAFVFYRVGRDVDLAEEAVQETFSRALASLDQFDAERGSMRSWLCSTSRNAVRDLLRGHKRAQELANRWDEIDRSLAQVFAALESEPLTDEVIEREETRDLVNMTIANLPDNYRDALVGKYIDGRSIDELAGDLSMSPQAAKSLLARARRAFREAFSTLCDTLMEVRV